MIDWLTFLVGGLLGSAHCVGMCGGFAVAIGASTPRWKPLLARQLLYSTGRVVTYSFLGAMGGFGGVYVSRFKTPLVDVQQGFSILAGVIMLAVGLSVLGVIRIPRRFVNGEAGCSIYAPVLRHFVGRREPIGVFLAGIATGFLPCGLVYAFLARTVAVGDVWGGMALMACFGIGTVPAMIAMGCGGGLISHTARARVLKVAACVVLAMGIVTIRRGLPTDAGGSDCCKVEPTTPTATQSTQPARPSTQPTP